MSIAALPSANRARALLLASVRALLLPSVAAAAILLALALALSLTGYDAPRALRALWEGSFGTWYAFTSATLVRATPLILAGLAVTLAFTAGVWNIGAEGQLLTGAAVAATIALATQATLGALALPIALLGGAAAGACWAATPALLRRRGVLEVISTIMLNFVALDLVGYLVRGPLQEPLRIYPQSPELAAAARIPRLLAGTRLHAGLLLAVAAAILLAWVLRRTAVGFRVRASGASASAARTAGRIDVDRTTLYAFLWSGALAGLAGAIELTGVTFALYENISPGYGYTAIAVALLARLHPVGVLFTALLFGALESGAVAMQRDAGVPSVVVAVVEALVILLVLAGDALRGRDGWFRRIAGQRASAAA